MLWTVLALLALCNGVAGTDTVPVVEWPRSGGGMLLERLLRERQPVVIRGSPAAQWPAAQHSWGWKDVLANGAANDALLDVQRSCAASRTFMYFDADSRHLLRDVDVDTETVLLRDVDVDTDTVLMGQGAGEETALQQIDDDGNAAVLQVEGGEDAAVLQVEDGEDAAALRYGEEEVEEDAVGVAEASRVAEAEVAAGSSGGAEHVGHSTVCYPHVRRMPLNEFMDAVRQDDAHALYLTETLDHEALAHLVPAFMPLHWMALHDLPPFHHEDWTADVVASLWAGSAAVTTQCHYDAQLNVFALVVGRKQFRLWPPSAAPQVALFPYLHPRARKSQLLSPMNASQPAMQVTLSPGDALFVPPFWLHHVTSLTPSIGMNVFSPSLEAQALDAMLRVPLPFPQAWASHELRAGACLFLHDVEETAALDDHAQLLSTLRRRYQRWQSSSADALPCVLCHLPPSWQTDSLRRQIKDRASAVVTALRHYTTSHGDMAGVQAIVLANFAETVAANVVDDATNATAVAAYLSSCWR